MRQRALFKQLLILSSVSPKITVDHGNRQMGITGFYAISMRKERSLLNPCAFNVFFSKELLGRHEVQSGQSA